MKNTICILNLFLVITITAFGYCSEDLGKEIIGLWKMYKNDGREKSIKEMYYLFKENKEIMITAIETDGAKVVQKGEYKIEGKILNIKPDNESTWYSVMVEIKDAIMIISEGGNEKFRIYFRRAGKR